MSRRSRRVRAAHGLVIDYVDGIVRLECPSSHVVGYLWQPDNDDIGTFRLDSRRRNAILVTAGETLLFTCTACGRDGKKLDLRLSQPRAEEIVDRAHRDRTREVHVHVLGG